MRLRPKTARRVESVPARSREMFEVHARLLGASAARGRQIKVRSGKRVQVIEAGEGPAVLFLHGSGTSSLSALSLLEHLEAVRMIAVDRPGFGLSEPAHVPRARFRDAAIQFVDEVADELQLSSFALAGGSMGATWALWYSLARPRRVRRLVLAGSAPLLPGTRAPAPLRLMATPLVGDVLSRVIKPNEKMVVRMMSSMGEKETIVEHPDLIEAIIVAGNDAIASAADLAELRAILTPFGFRRSLRVRPDELRRLAAPTLLIWGDHDPVGTVAVAQTVTRLVPGAQLEVLPAGHAVWLGDPKRVSMLLSSFVRSGTLDDCTS